MPVPPNELISLPDEDNFTKAKLSAAAVALYPETMTSFDEVIPIPLASEPIPPKERINSPLFAKFE